MTKERLHINLKFTKVDLEVKIETDRITINHTIDLSVGIGIKIEIEEITTIETIIGQIIGIDQGTTIGMTIEEITTDLMIGKIVTDKMIGETIIDKTIEETILEIDKIMTEMTLNRDIEIEVRVGRIQEIIIVTIQEIEVEIGVETNATKS